MTQFICFQISHNHPSIPPIFRNKYVTKVMRTSGKYLCVSNEYSIFLWDILYIYILYTHLIPYLHIINYSRHIYSYSLGSHFVTCVYQVPCVDDQSEKYERLCPEITLCCSGWFRNYLNHIISVEYSDL